MKKSQRMLGALGEVNAETILAAGVPRLQGLGMTFRKAEYITDFAEKVHTGTFDLDAELDLWFSSVGKVRFEFAANCNVQEINRVISEYVLNN